MIFEEFFKGFSSLSQLAGVREDSPPAEFPGLPSQPQPLCTSTGLSVYAPKEPSLLDLLPPRLAALPGLRLFRNEAIPLANVSTSRNTIVFSDTKVGSSSNDYFTLKNDSECPVDYTINGIPDGFSVTPTSGRISAKSSVSINVTFRPTYEQYYSGYINPSPGASSVSVSGKGIKN